MAAISVIVPVYNVEEFLEKCVSSLLMQTSAPEEIILVDDGSTDSSGQICDRLAKDHPELIRVIHQPNAGLGGARNTGLEAAVGDYLLFIDSDDTVELTLVEKLRPFADMGTDMTIFDARTVDINGNTLGINADNYDESAVLCLDRNPELIFGWPCAWANLYKKTLFTDSGIRYPSRVWYEDIRTTTKLYTCAKTIRYLHQPLYNYLSRPGSITKNAVVHRNREILDAFEDILSYYREKQLFDRYRNELEYLAVNHVFVAASVRVLRIDPKAPLLGEFYQWMERTFPAFRKNPYLSRLSGTKKLAYTLVDHRQYRLLALLFKLKK